MKVSELVQALKDVPSDCADANLMIGIKPLTGETALLVQREPWDDDILIWDGK